MNPLSICTATVFAPSLLCCLLAPTASAQQRAFPPIPESFDVKTAPEPSRAPDAIVPRPAAQPAAAPAKVEPARAPRTRVVDPKAPIGGVHGVDHSRMYYDTPGDGSLWARGAHYKASFDASGATYFPLFSPRQPRHFPHALSPDAVTIGGVPVAFDHAVPAVRDCDRIEMDRGSFVETYVLGTDSIEQSFVFRSIPRNGDLVVHIPLASELESTAGAAGLEFRSEFGRMSYGTAVAIDAAGRRADAVTELVDGSIAIRVDASFLATAALPLVIDPVVSTFDIDTSSFDDFTPDVAYDAGTQRWLVVYEETATASDRDVYYVILNSAGASLWGGYVNMNNASWYAVRCANLAAATQFLAVCSVNGSGSIAIRGREIQANIQSLSSEFFISGSESGDMYDADVGGDPYPLLPSNYCVAYERGYSLDDHDILVRFVAPDTTLIGTNPNFLSNSSGTLDGNPSVSKSNDGNTWTIVWERYYPGPGHQNADIWAGRITYSGNVVNPPFQLTGGHIDGEATVSSPLPGTPRTLVTFSRDYGTDDDIEAMLIDGVTAVETVDLSTLVNNGFFMKNQAHPCVDTDGAHFLVAYSEQYVTGQNDYDIYVDDLYLIGNALGSSQNHVNLAFTGYYEDYPRIASTHGSGGPDKRYLAAWSKELSATSHDIEGALFDGNEGGTSSAFCFGDGSGAACPCGNNGAIGHGCANSANASGALLGLTGAPSTIHDSAVLHVSGMPATAPCTFFQGTTSATAVFGDGLKCAGGSLIRLKTVTASGGAASFPGAGDPTLSVRGGVPVGGGFRDYQVSYRNNASFCTSATFNISNGVIINWAQ